MILDLSSLLRLFKAQNNVSVIVPRALEKNILLV